VRVDTPPPIVGPRVVQRTPLQQPAFEIVQDLTPSGSLTETEWSDQSRTDLERFADIAKLADAFKFVDVGSGTTQAGINLAGKVPGGTLKPGLNYASQLRSKFPDAPGGETGYLDAQDAYHNPDLPAERDGPLPRIVIILGPNAFRHGKANALATLRHEMEHARHAQLALAWLVKWRAERPTASYKDWLASQVKARQLSAVEAAVIASGTGGGTAGTEVLAWTEGLVTSLPFIPAVDVNLVLSDDKYPATIRALRGAGEQFKLVASNTELTKAALDRIRNVCCKVLAQPQRDRLVEWTEFLINPAGRSMPASALKLLVAYFGASTDFLTRVRDIARKPCVAKRTP
jgi:hypothetical protein